MPDTDNNLKEMSEEEIAKEEKTKEFAKMKETATMLGIRYSPNIGFLTLKKRIDSVYDNVEERNQYTDKTELRNKLMRLIRFRLTCMDSTKKNWKGEVFTISTKITGTIRKYIPFKDIRDGYHAPFIIVEHLKAMKHQEFKKIKIKGREVVKGYLVPSFAIEELAPLTPEELDELKQKQALNHSIE